MEGQRPGQHLILEEHAWKETATWCRENNLVTNRDSPSAISPPPLLQPSPHHEHPKGPPVRRDAMSTAVDHLWGHVLNCPTEGEGLLGVIIDGLLAQTKVGQFDVAISVQQDTVQREGEERREG